ncbi:lazarillo protein-like [Schistocerca americana]|uniref:lazarillo protein-like n=1 Tax=Schistocerca americana TaxID=7009 RepID=UPI001F4F9878|nr:lazarillo protein-like [Schistocerca americana]
MTSRTTSVLLLLMVVAPPALSQLLGVGSCPDVVQLSKIDSTSMLGTWYEYMRYFNNIELFSKCVTATLARAADNSTIQITASMLNYAFWQQDTIKGTAIEFGGDGSGRFTVTYPELNFSGAVMILESDYDAYAVLWSCNKIGLLHNKYSWILTRQKKPSRETVKKIEAVLRANGLTTRPYIKTAQNCD